jgi:dienelactone hydrolase
MAIRLKALLPPDKAVRATPAETAAYKGTLQTRASKFPDDPAAFRIWQQEMRGRLAARLMGGGFLPPRIPLDARTTETREYPKFTLRRVTYRTQPDRENSLLISLPKGVTKAPLLLALHGHEANWGEADAAAYSAGHADDFCAYFAERGWAVLQPATMNHKLQHADWTLQGEWSWDAMRALDYAAAVAEVDMTRVAVCGLSTGAHLAMNVLALDERVKAGVVAGILVPWDHLRRRFRVPPHCDCGISSQLADLFEECDWAALAAPRPVQFHHGRKDSAMCPDADESLLNLKWNTGILPGAEYEALFTEVQRAWRVTGKPAGTETFFHEAGHAVNNPAAFAWLSAALAGH